mgnify:CR=1 FL=1
MKIEVIPSVLEGYQNHLKNKLYSLLCAREENNEWETFLDSILIELEGIPYDNRGINFLTLYFKINSLRHIDYKWFRKTIFDCMSLLSCQEEEKNVIL